MKKNLNNRQFKFTVKSYWFIFAISLYFSFVLNISFWRFIANNIEITNFGTALFALSLPFFIFVPLYIIFNIFVTPYLAKPISILLLLISSAANYFMYAYGVYIDSDMITNVFETTARETFDLASFPFFAAVFITGVIPSIVILFTKIEYRALQAELKIRILFSIISIFIAGFFIAAFYKDYTSFGRNNREVRKLLNTINYTYSIVKYFKLKTDAKRNFVRLDENAKHMPNAVQHKSVFVIIVGETARAKSFSLDGYAKDTNPLLSKQDIIYNKAASCGTSTAVSLPCMFSNLPQKDFDKDDAKYTENLIDIIAQSGYDVWWEDNDDGCKGVCARVKTEYTVKTNNPKYCFGSYCHDEALIEGLEDKIKNIENDTVIVLHTMGSHGPTYYNRYPDRFKKFTPTCDTANIQNCSKEAIANTYDNTILYTDYIISSTIDILKNFTNLEIGLMYVSDHGESLGEDNIYLHGLPYMIAPKEQTEVPMIIWMSENMKKYNRIDYECMKKEASNKTYSHDNIFHSIINLLEINTTLYDEKY
ncbi:MAG: phosphoethanolamine--lipid A transferase, partial [Campylobacteraceae bacterium]|nr:phosphoethanolamine--lipid A transferase [Campylobacteraceae bacterium]